MMEGALTLEPYLEYALNVRMHMAVEGMLAGYLWTINSG